VLPAPGDGDPMPPGPGDGDPLLPEPGGELVGGGEGMGVGAAGVGVYAGCLGGRMGLDTGAGPRAATVGGRATVGAGLVGAGPAPGVSAYSGIWPAAGGADVGGVVTGWLAAGAGRCDATRAAGRAGACLAACGPPGRTSAEPIAALMASAAAQAAAR
jgi:hypothetical protein